MIYITKTQLCILKKILKEYVSEYIVWVFGSRIVGSTKPYADLDLAIISDSPLSPSILGQLKDAFSESNLPFKIDVVDWATTSEEFKTIIEAKYEVLPLD